MKIFYSENPVSLEGRQRGFTGAYWGSRMLMPLVIMGITLVGLQMGYAAIKYTLIIACFLPMVLLMLRFRGGDVCNTFFFAMDHSGRLYVLPGRDIAGSPMKWEVRLLLLDHDKETDTIPRLPEKSREILRTLSLKEAEDGFQVRLMADGKLGPKLLRCHITRDYHGYEELRQAFEKRK